MMDRNFVSLVVWSLVPLMWFLGFMFHGVLWLSLLGLRKAFQLRHETGFAAAVLHERARRNSALTFASLISFRIRRLIAGLRFELETAIMPRSPRWSRARTG